MTKPITKRGRSKAWLGQPGRRTNIDMANPDDCDGLRRAAAEVHEDLGLPAPALAGKPDDPVT